MKMDILPVLRRYGNAVFDALRRADIYRRVHDLETSQEYLISVIREAGERKIRRSFCETLQGLEIVPIFNSGIYKTVIENCSR